MVLSTEALKAGVATYKEAMEEAAVNVAANAVVGTSGGARWAGEPVVIEPDDDENESHDEGHILPLRRRLRQKITKFI